MKLLHSILILMLICSCEQIKKSDFWEKNWVNGVECLQEIKIADSLILIGKLVYCHPLWPLNPNIIRGKSEFIALLKKHDVYFMNDFYTCNQEYNETHHCFSKLMKAALENKFGKNFIDSLLNIADYQFAINNRDSVFDNTYRTETDEPAIFPSNSPEDDNGLQKAFNKIVKYPENYQYSDGENSSAYANIKIETDKFGNTKVKDIQFIFNTSDDQENVNKEHYPYLEKLIDSIVENTKWKPAMIRSFNVKSIDEIYLGFE